MVAPFARCGVRPGLAFAGPLEAAWAKRHGGETISIKFNAPLSLWDSESHLNLEVDLPGVVAEGLDVSVHDGRLFIRGERKKSEESRRYLLDEIRYGKFEHVLSLPDSVDPTSVSADLVSGVLKISLAKKPVSQPTKVEVRQG